LFVATETNSGRVLNASSCDGNLGLTALQSDWRLLAAWLGSLLVATCATCLLATAMPSQNEVLAMRQRCAATTTTATTTTRARPIDGGKNTTRVPQLKPPSCYCLLPSAALRCARNHAAGKRSKEQLKAAASKAKQILTGELTLDGDVEVRSSRHILDNTCAYPPRTFHPQDSINNLPTRIFLFIL
jgi:hypothetical protein